MNARDLNTQVTTLSAQNRHQEAIDLMDANIASIDPDVQTPIILQAFYAAQRGGLDAEAHRLAREVHKREPETPSIQDFI